MAQTTFGGVASAPYLNSNEQNLLLSALQSNKPTSGQGGDNAEPTQFGSPADDTLFEGLDNPSLLDGDFDADNLNWDIDGAALMKMRDNNDQPRSASADGEDSPQSGHPGDKRKDHPDDASGSDDGSMKRRESEERSSKKPGRKPLTNEPTSKRKAQNRAAQRAFRERKEKHLKDLEQKVDDLEKASEATNHENGILRAQVDRMNAELKEYRSRLGSIAGNAGYSPTQPVNKVNWDIGHNFDFEFPTFGTDTNLNKSENKRSQNPFQGLNDLEKVSADRSFFRTASTNSEQWSPSPVGNTRSMSTSTSTGTFKNLGNGDSPASKARSSTTSTEKSNFDSPGSFGLTSSCVTTPEASADSPGQGTQNNKAASISSVDNRASASPSQPKTPGQENLQNIDWFAGQNNGLFDPVLFGDYREPQDNILNNTDLNLSFFDDAFPWNPASNYSAPYPSNAAFVPTLPAKKSLMEQVEQVATGKEPETPTNGQPKQLTCAKLWDRVQSSEKVLSGEIDMDSLCSQLKAKAKCGGSSRGAVVDEEDVDAILGPDLSKLKQQPKQTGMWNMFH